MRVDCAGERLLGWLADKYPPLRPPCAALYNATNLAIKGVAGLAAFGYIVEQYTGNLTRAEEIYATAAEYASVMVDYAWVDAGAQSHFMLGYRGSQADGGLPDSWPMIYNALVCAPT